MEAQDTDFDNLLTFYKKNAINNDPVKYNDSISLMSIDVSYNQPTKANYFLYKDNDSSGSTITKAPQNLQNNVDIANGYLFNIYSNTNSKNVNNSNITYGDWDIRLQNKAMGIDNNSRSFMGSWGGGIDQWGDLTWSSYVSKGAQYHFSPVSKSWSNTHNVCYGDIIQIGSASTDGKQNIEQILSTAWIPGATLNIPGVESYSIASEQLSGVGGGTIKPSTYWMLWSNPSQLLTKSKLNFPLPGSINNNLTTSGGATFSTNKSPSPTNTYWVICRPDGVSPYDTNVNNRITNMSNYCSQKNSEHSTRTRQCRNNLSTCIGYNEINDMAYGCRNLYLNNVQCNNTNSTFQTYCNNKCGRSLTNISMSDQEANMKLGKAPQGGIVGACDTDMECSCIDYINSKKYKDTYTYLSTNSAVNSGESYIMQNNTALNFVNQAAKCWFPGCTTSDSLPSNPNGFVYGNNTTLFKPSSWASKGNNCSEGAACSSINLQICNALGIETGDNAKISDVRSSINCKQNTGGGTGGGGGGGGGGGSGGGTGGVNTKLILIIIGSIIGLSITLGVSIYFLKSKKITKSISKPKFGRKKY